MARGLARVGIFTSCAAALSLLVGPGFGTARAAPIELVEQRDQYLLFDDVDNSVEYAFWFDRPGFLAGYADVEEGLLAVHPDDSQFIVVYSTWSLPFGIGAFYQSVANDVEGIGFEHIAPEDAVIPEPYFDDTPNSQVQGFLHMNRWDQYLDDDGQIDDATTSLIFGQELGHAWGSFVYYDQGDGPQGDILGRSNAHWSFYLHSGGSPMQGHAWTDNGDGTFTAAQQSVFLYSDLDLYLMGLVPAEDVQPWFLLDNPTNCVDAASGDSECAPPDAFLFQADTYTINATRRDITIEDVLAVEGPRVPAWPDAPDTFDVSFVLLKRPDEVLSEEELMMLDAIIERSIELFEMQTRGLGRVVNRTAVDGPDPDPGGTTDGGGSSSGDGLDDTGTADNSASTSSSSGGTGETSGQDTEPSGCGCQTSERTAPRWLLLVLMGLALRRRRLRR